MSVSVSRGALWQLQLRGNSGGTGVPPQFVHAVMVGRMAQLSYLFGKVGISPFYRRDTAEEGCTLTHPPNGAMSAVETRQQEQQHIFAVNGSSDFLEVVRLLLEIKDYNVTTTNFVPKTFDQVLAIGPALVIIDLAFGAQAGWDLLERLHADPSTHGIPVIVVSTSPAYLERVRANFGRYGGQRFLSKPLEIDDLLAAVVDLIGPAHVSRPVTDVAVPFDAHSPAVPPSRQ